MAKGYIKAQNDVEIEIVDAKSRADVASIKSQISKFTTPSGELEIAENGTFDVTKYASVLVNVLSGGNTGGDTGSESGGGTVTPDSGSTSGNTWFSLYTVEEAYKTCAEGWELVIPHGLGVVPSSAIVMRMGVIADASKFRGWIGNHLDPKSENIRMTNDTGLNREALSFHDSAAQYLYADDTNLYCRSGGWGGTLETGAVLMVAVGLNGGAGDA